MIGRERQPLIMDFGLARQIGKQDETRLTPDGMILATPADMSPEQVDGDLKTGKQSDVYSLGVILFELLTGDLPFVRTIAAIIGQIMTQDAPPPSKFRSQVDPELDAICQKMMSRKVGDRYAGMKEVAQALTDYLKGKASGRRKPADGQPQANATAAPLQTLTTDEGLAAFLATAPNEDFPVTSQRRVGAGTQLLDPWKKLPSRTKVIATSALAGLLLMMSVVFMLPTPGGMLCIEVLDGEDIEVLVDGKSVKLTDGKWSEEKDEREHRLALRINGQTLTFDNGTKLFEFGEDGEDAVSVTIGGILLSGKNFEVVRGKETVLTIKVIRNDGGGWTPPTPSLSDPSLELVQTFDDVTLLRQKVSNLPIPASPSRSGRTMRGNSAYSTR